VAKSQASVMHSHTCIAMSGGVVPLSSYSIYSPKIEDDENGEDRVQQAIAMCISNWSVPSLPCVRNLCCTIISIYFCKLPRAYCRLGCLPDFTWRRLLD